MPQLFVRSSSVRPGLAFTAVSTLLVGALTGVALAGPSWDQDLVDDAKQTALTAQVITNPLTSYISIQGRLSGSGFVDSDFVDMYQFQILEDMTVSISTAGGTLGGYAAFDSQLYLFRRKGQSDNVRAVALKGNDNAGQGNSGSRIGEGSAFSNTVALKKGIYYLAITGAGSSAFSDVGNVIWPDLGAAGETVSGLERSLDNWAGTGQSGEYTIRLQVAQNSLVPSPGALALLGLGALSRRGRRR